MLEREEVEEDEIHEIQPFKLRNSRNHLLLDHQVRNTFPSHLPLFYNICFSRYKCRSSYQKNKTSLSEDETEADSFWFEVSSLRRLRWVPSLQSRVEEQHFHITCDQIQDFGQGKDTAYIPRGVYLALSTPQLLFFWAALVQSFFFFLPSHASFKIRTWQLLTLQKESTRSRQRGIFVLCISFRVLQTCYGWARCWVLLKF